MKSLRFSNLSLLILLIFILSCSKTSTVYTKDGAAIEGKITRSEASTIYIHQTEPLEEGGEHPDGVFDSKIFDKCMADRTNNCGKICDKSYRISEDLQRCMRSCMDLHKAKEVCKPISVVVPVSRSNIEDISYPGKTATIVGTIMVALGGPVGFVMITSGEGCCDDPEDNDAQLAMIVGGLVLEAAAFLSVFIALWGYTTWTSASSAAAPPKDTAGPKISPVAVTDGRRTYYGLGFTFSW